MTCDYELAPFDFDIHPIIFPRMAIWKINPSVMTLVWLWINLVTLIWVRYNPLQRIKPPPRLWPHCDPLPVVIPVLHSIASRPQGKTRFLHSSKFTFHFSVWNSIGAFRQSRGILSGKQIVRIRTLFLKPSKEAIILSMWNHRNCKWNCEANFALCAPSFVTSKK